MALAASKAWPSTYKVRDGYRNARQTPGIFLRAIKVLREYNVDAMTYRVVLQQSEEGFSVSCPGLPGCWSQGATEDEALENIRNAIQEYMEVVNDLTRGQNVRVIEVAAS